MFYRILFLLLYFLTSTYAMTHKLEEKLIQSSYRCLSRQYYSHHAPSTELVEIAVVGGGSTGISFISQFLREIKHHVHRDKFSIKLFEPSGTLGTGLAYSAKSHALLLNSPASCFSIYPEDQKHFLKWAQQHPEKWTRHFPEIREINEDTFVPRKLAGLYLSDAANQAKNLANKYNIQYQVVEDEVVNIIETPAPLKTALLTKHKPLRYSADHIILCTGNCAPESYVALKKHPNYFHTIHSDEEKIKESIKSISSVLVIGTRLSAIDAALMLKDQNYHGHITMASRNGRLPSVKNEFKIYNLKHLTTESIQRQMRAYSALKIEHLVTLIEKEASDIYGSEISMDKIARYTHDPVTTLKNDLETIRNGEALWQKIPAVFIELIEMYWSNFSIEEKKRYLRDYVGIMQRYTSAFPFVNAEKINGMLCDDQLTIKSGLREINYDDEKRRFVAHYCGNDGIITHEYFDCVLNATGSGKNLTRSEASLYSNLLQSDSVSFNIFGGLDVSTQNFRVAAKKNFKAQMYAAGSPTFGSYFFTNYFYTSAKQSKTIVEDILRSSKF